MNPQQRIAALGTDKELSDLLDFSAVGRLFFFTGSQQTGLEAPVTHCTLCSDSVLEVRGHTARASNPIDMPLIPVMKNRTG